MSMLRRSSRNRRPCFVDPTFSMVGEDEDLTASDIEYEQPKKMRKKRNDPEAQHQGKNPRGRRGLLKELTEMPLDILFEIFGHLNPADILHLARTTKALRAILMSRSAISVWRHARSNLKDFPDCPSDLTEPQYAHLAFDSLCHYCFQSNTPTILWSNRTRCCKKCMHENFTDCLYGHLRSSCLISIVPTIMVKSGYRSRIQQMYCLRTAKGYDEAYTKLNEAEKRVWFLAQSEFSRSRIEHAKLCEIWHKDRSNVRSLELDEARRQRQEDVTRRLTEIGWGEEFRPNAFLDPLVTHKLVKQPKRLTDQTWNNIKPTLIEVMEGIKASRLKIERRAVLRTRHDILLQVYQDFVASQSINAIIPEVGDVSMMEPFKAVIFDTPVEEEITKDHFETAVKELPTLVEIWRQCKTKELLETVKKSLELDEDPPESILCLAVTKFSCYWCTHLLGFPQVLVHNCMSVHQHTDDSEYKDTFFDLRRQPWNFGGRRVSLSKGIQKRFSSLLSACGYDPNVTTAQGLAGNRYLFECLNCKKEETGRLIMEYPLLNHDPLHKVVPALLNEEEHSLAKSIEMEGRLIRYANSSYYRSWVCVRCKKRECWNELKGHILKEHPEEARDDTHPLVEFEDYVTHIDAPSLIYSQSVRLKPKELLDATGVET